MVDKLDDVSHLMVVSNLVSLVVIIGYLIQIKDDGGCVGRRGWDGEDGIDTIIRFNLA